jgi:hypothetical protein
MPKQKSKKQSTKGSRAARKKDNTHPYWYFDGAIASALFGHSDPAFWYLEKALGRGFRECSWLRGREFSKLRKDKRWPAILKRCEANLRAYLKSVNAELFHMHERYQKEGFRQKLNPAVRERRNAWRRKKVRKMLDSGALKAADDFERAASIICHGPDSSDHQLARKLALKALKLDPKNVGAEVVAAMAKDRYLLSIGKPQIYGTQFDYIRGKEILKEPYDLKAITDKEREKWCGSLLCKMIKSALENSEARKRKSKKPGARHSRKARR